MGRTYMYMEKRVYIQVKNEGFLMDMKSILFFIIHDKKGILRLILELTSSPHILFALFRR